MEKITDISSRKKTGISRNTSVNTKSFMNPRFPPKDSILITSLSEGNFFNSLEAFHRLVSTKEKMRRGGRINR